MGKSSLLLSLLRLLDTTQGTITVDGIDIAQLARSTLHERAFVTVAQEAFFLLQASLWFNLDFGAQGSTLLRDHVCAEEDGSVGPLRRQHDEQEDHSGR